MYYLVSLLLILVSLLLILIFISNLLLSLIIIMFTIAMHCRPLVTSYCRKPSQGSMARIASAEDVRLEDSNAFSTVV